MDISLHGIEKSFGKLQALKPIELEIKSGEFVSLLGPSGCGKTTLLRIIAGLENADDGQIDFGGKTVYSKKKRINASPQKRHIGMVFQDFALWPHMTVFENVAYGLRATGKKKGLKEKVAEALGNVQLGDYAERYPHQLSGGQQQRVAIARAIANDPSIILMDEPLSALDATLRDEMRILLQALVKKLNMTAIYVTHDQNEAMAMSDRIVVMNQGTVMQVGSPETVYQKPANETVARFVGKGALIEGTHTLYDRVHYLKLNQNAAIPFAKNFLEEESFNTRVTAVIRPEQINLSRTAKETGLQGEVETASFLGERYEVTFKISGTEQLMFAYSDVRLSPGQTIFFEVTGQNIHVMKTKLGGEEHETA
ncbi:ABC transporter ATP-binding protein [Alteribacter lacisalsi]|uniref:Carnitine transport ATP-binding protein OpuCA n=1 Tax=Alteribacter lacisalsi TaxID=2045244 RepID=A0A2W0HQ87_9BACI|nr:ABC transporter ATP-binding protein [Alteribacter lacisalsi]PYZ99029.1 ABC transporter ATP-binding protein [Alteribacter lacisalsi]